jgi:L-xylulokinase
MKQYAIGLDNGGTVTKAALFDTEGHELCVASQSTPVTSPQPGYTERDMEVLWQANCSCIRRVLEQSGIDPSQLIGIAVCGHGKGLYLWGKDDRPAYQGIGSTDNRAWQVVERWYADGTFEALYPQLCQQLLACQQAALLRWLKDEKPEIYQNIRYVFSAKDYIRFRLTGEAYCEATDISGSGLMDVKNGRFDRKLLETLGIGEVFDALTALKYSSDCCGHVTAQTAAETGLPEGLPVAGGMFDVDACAIASAVTKPGQVCTITGTWSINECISDHPVVNTAIAMNSLYAIPGYYLLEESSATSAGNLEWAIANCIDTGGLTGGALYAELARLADSVRPEESEVYYLPFLYGSNAHPLAKASFVGMTSYHTRAHMIRAVYEGVAYSHKKHLDTLLSVCPKPDCIRMAGGAVNSPFWVQMFADVLDSRIETVDGVHELGALGCAMAACVMAGVYADYEQAAAHMVRVNPPVEPDAARHAVYAAKYQKYRAISDALDQVWPQFSV